MTAVMDHYSTKTRINENNDKTQNMKLIHKRNFKFVNANPMILLTNSKQNNRSR